MAKFEIMALPRKYILFIMCIVGLGRPALFANEVHKFTHTHTSNIFYIYTSGKNHFHEMNGDVGMAQWK